MAYKLRWQQQHGADRIEMEHEFDDLDKAKAFGQGLGPDARAAIFDAAADRPGEVEKPMWEADTPQATEKERDAARAANVVGKSEGVGPNTKPDTREDKPEDLKEIMGNKPGGPDQTVQPADKPVGAAPAGARNLDADKGSGDQKPQDGSSSSGSSSGSGSGRSR